VDSTCAESKIGTQLTLIASTEGMKWWDAMPGDPEAKSV
jgi:hypothetical protein